MDSTTRALIERLRENPEDACAYERLRAYYLADGDLASAANLIEGWGARRNDPVAASQAYVDAAQLVLEMPDEAPRFVSLLELALTLHPPHVRANELLHRHFVDRADADGWIRSLERRRDNLARAARHRSEIAELEYRLGEAWAKHHRRIDRAALHYRAAYELDPSHVASMYAARQIYQDAGNAKAAIRLLELEARAEPDRARKVALYHELQSRLERDLGDLPGAIEAARLVLSIEPAGARADDRRRWLTDAHASLGHIDEAMRCLAPLVSAGDEMACRKLVELSDAHPELEAPLRVPALDHLARLYESEKRYDATAAVLERLLVSLEDPDLQVAVAARLARLALGALNDPPLAVRALERWAALDPSDLEPRRRLAELLPQEHAGEIVEDVGELVEDVEELVEDVGDAVEDVEELVEDVADAVEDVEDAVEDVEDVEELVEDVEDADALVEELTENASEVVEAVDDLVEDLGANAELVEDSEIIELRR
jgi:tetratricopeptide (TPR) repeat protein